MWGDGSVCWAGVSIVFGERDGEEWGGEVDRENEGGVLQVVVSGLCEIEWIDDDRVEWCRFDKIWKVNAFKSPEVKYSE